MLKVLQLEGHLQWNLTWLFVCSFILVIYMMFSYIRSNEKREKNQSFLFFLSILLLYLLIGSPLYSLSHLTISFHMIFMSVLFFIIPPLFLFGLQKEIIYIGIKFLFIPPTIALFSFASLFFLYHLPFVLLFLQQYSLFHSLYIFIMFYLSFFIWLPFVRFGQRKKESKQYARLNSVVIMPACLLFIFVSFFGNGGNPLMTQLFLSLCLPAEEATKLLPFPYHPQYDLFFAGLLMIIIHKFAIFIALALQNNEREIRKIKW